MKILSGVTDQYIYFVAVDATDLQTRETGLSSFTVYRSRNGAAAAVMTTPTINETDVTNMPGVYELLLDEDTTIASGNDTEEIVFHITQAAMSPVTRTIELYRGKITSGYTLGVASNGDISGNIDGNVSGNVDGSVASLTGHTAQTGDSYARIGIGGIGLTSISGGSSLTASEIVDEWETQSQADPTGFHVNVKEVNDTAQTANDIGADANTLVARDDPALIIGFAGVGLTHLAESSINTEVRLAELDSGNIPSDIDSIPTTAMRGTDGVDTATMRGTDDSVLATSVGFAGVGLTHLATASNLTTVNTVVDSILAMLDDPRSEPSQGAPAVNADAMTKLDYLYKFMRNKVITGSTSINIYDDAGTTIDHISTIGAVGSTFTRDEFITGA